MTGTTINNLNELIYLINDQQNILRYNSDIESSISQNGGTVVYSYNNIIMASEISDELYNELQKNPYIEYIQELPLKKYGEIDINLIGQLDTNTLAYFNDTDVFNTGTTNTNGIDGLSGSTKKPITNNLENNISVGTSSNIPPVITNQNLTISTSDNWFSYELFANGTSPITFEIITPSNYNGILFLKNGNIISGQTNYEGIYNIIVRVTNNYGSDTKNLVLTVSNYIKITNTNLEVYSKIGTRFTYNIESTGNPPKTYDVTGIPTGLTLNNNIISGVFTVEDTYNMTITVSGLTSSDSKDLTIISGQSPFITSPGQVISEQYNNFTYLIRSSASSGVTYNVIGILPEGLQFKVDTISGVPIYSGTSEVTIKSTNPFGEGSRILIITIYQP